MMYNKVLKFIILVVLIAYQSTRSDAKPAPKNNDEHPKTVPPCGDECKFDFLGQKCKPESANMKKFPSFKDKPRHGAARCLKTVFCGALIFSTKILNHLEETKPGNPCNVDWGSVPVRRHFRLPEMKNPIALPPGSYTISDPSQMRRNKQRRNRASAR